MFQPKTHFLRSTWSRKVWAKKSGADISDFEEAALIIQGEDGGAEVKNIPVWDKLITAHYSWQPRKTQNCSGALASHSESRPRAISIKVFSQKENILVSSLWIRERPFRLWFCPTTSNGPFYFSESPLLIFPSNKCHKFSGRYFQLRVEPANSVLLLPSLGVCFWRCCPIPLFLWPFPTTIKSLPLTLFETAFAFSLFRLPSV